MRYYFLGDIHGNNHALERCLSHLDEQKVGVVYCLGDLVGWLPLGNRTQELAANRFFGHIETIRKYLEVLEK